MSKRLWRAITRQLQRRTWWDNAFGGLQLMGLIGGWWGESFDTGLFLMMVVLGWYCATSVVLVLAGKAKEDGTEHGY